MIASATVTDPLGGSASAAVTLPVSGATGLHVIKRTVMSDRVNWGSVGDPTMQGPTLHTEGAAGPEYIQAPDGPLTLAHTFTMLRDCDIIGLRIYKAPNLAGTIPIRLWDAVGAVLHSDSVVWVADEGGWREIIFSAPVSVDQDSEYTLGYLAPANDYAFSTWVFQAQDYIDYPFRTKTFFQTTITRDGNARHTGAGTTITFPNANTDRVPTNYYIAPIAEWTTDLPVYTGLEYFDQFETAGSSFAFPVGFWWPESTRYGDYKAIGINTVYAGPPSDDKCEAIKVHELDWYPSIHTDAGPGDVTAVIDTLEDPALAPYVKGYFLTDEPDLILPYQSPADLRADANLVRQRDSSRPIMLNLSYNVVKNQGFTFTPVGATTNTANVHFREYAETTDMLCVDFYSLAGSDSYNPTPSEINHESTGRYGVWAYADAISRLRNISDDTKPTWILIEGTSMVPDRPFPEDVRKACWSSIIAGATGIVFFGARFSSLAVTQDFDAILHNPAMSSMITSLSALLQSLGAAILSPETNLVSNVDSSNTTEGPIGGTWGVPIHYMTRTAGGTSYLFAQAIRPGATSGTFTVPTAAGEVLSVVGEGRTVTADGSGVFTDTFAADYSVHIYSWGAVAGGSGIPIAATDSISSGDSFDAGGLIP